MNTAFVLGGVDMDRWIDFRNLQAEQFAEFMSLGREQLGFSSRRMSPGVKTSRCFSGRVSRGCPPRHRRHDRSRDPFPPLPWSVIATSSVSTRPASKTPTCCRARASSAYGIPGGSRGVGKLLRAQWSDGVALGSEVGVSPSVSTKFPVISVPYEALLPARLDGLLACGRHISCDPSSHGFMREIPQCWLTGQAAGAAAAVAVNAGVQPRAVNVRDVQAVAPQAGCVHTRRRERLECRPIATQAYEPYLDPSACSSALAS